MYGSHFLDLSNSLKWLIRFTPQSLYRRYHWTEGRVGFRTGPDDLHKWMYFILPGLELWSLNKPARVQSLYRQRYRYSQSVLLTLWKFLVIPVLELRNLGNTARNQQQSRQCYNEMRKCSIDTVGPRTDSVLRLLDFESESCCLEDFQGLQHSCKGLLIYYVIYT